MAKEHLDQAYTLIKKGQIKEAIQILEPLIRANPDDGDAWWLYANAIDNPAAKRNALNNVLRIGTSVERESLAKNLLHSIQNRDAYEFSSPQEVAPKTFSRASRRSKLAVGVVAIFVMVACAACSAFYNLVGTMVQTPTTYEYHGEIQDDDIITGSVSTEDTEWDAYLYTGAEGEILNVTVRPVQNDAVPPFIFLYGPDDLFITLSNQMSPNANHISVPLTQDGDYLILVRTFFGLGSGTYDLSISSTK